MSNTQRTSAIMDSASECSLSATAGLSRVLPAPIGPPINSSAFLKSTLWPFSQAVSTIESPNVSLPSTKPQRYPGEEVQGKIGRPGYRALRRSYPFVVLVVLARPIGPVPFGSPSKKPPILEGARGSAAGNPSKIRAAEVP
jgi:hypothetical protein